MRLLLSTFFIYFHTQHHNTTSIQTNKTKQNETTDIYSIFQKSNQKGERAPLICAVVHSQVTICRRLWIQYVFPHMCGVNQFCIIVFFAAVKPANNILFCIKLIQRPESSLRRHKLGLTDQSICSKEDKTRFTCVHRLMTMGHSQNI